MTREEIAARVRKVITEHFAETGRRPQPTEITDATSLAEDCGADSLDNIEITMSLEEEFGVEIGDEDAEANKTVGDIVTWLQRQPYLVPPHDVDEPEACIACAVAFKEGDMVLDDLSGGCIHVACCGPEREGYVKDLDSGEPLGPDDKIPTGYAWTEHPKAVAA